MPIIEVDSNEEPFEVQDEGGESWSQHKTLEDAIAAFHKTATEKRGCSATDYGDGAYLMLTLFRGKAGKTCVDPHELQPTAEWSRIQERLKRADELSAELERVSNCEEWYNEDEAANIIDRDFIDASPDIDRELFAKHLNLAFRKGSQIGGGQTQAELNLLSAELERVKAERDGALRMRKFYRSKMSDAQYDHLCACSRLVDLKSRLPVNADGDEITIGMNQYVVDESTVTGSAQWYVKGILMSEKDNSQFVIQVKSYRNGEVRTIDPSSCHTTSESCRAAGGAE